LAALRVNPIDGVIYIDAGQTSAG